MTRLLLCLPFFLFFALLYPRPQVSEPAADPLPPPQVARESPPLPEKDILRFIEKSIERYDREVTGYRTLLTKQERQNGKLNRREVVEADFREKPFSVRMRWQQGGSLARAALYVQGENDNKILIRLAFFTVQKSLDDPMVQSTGRYTIDQFGIRKGMERVLREWQDRREAGRLNLVYEGIEAVTKSGGRQCYKIHRLRTPEPEEDGVSEVVLYYDVERWLQIGTILRGAQGELVGEYFFDIQELNPTFAPGDFTRKRLEQKD